jgi:hypothetical protein
MKKRKGKLHRWSLWYAIIIFYSPWFKKFMKGPRGMQLLQIDPWRQILLNFLTDSVKMPRQRHLSPIRWRHVSILIIKKKLLKNK